MKNHSFDLNSCSTISEAKKKEARQKITDHIEKYIGKIAWVYSDPTYKKAGILVNVVNPEAEKEFFTLVTSGMSFVPMDIPEEAANFKYSELILCLPATWKLRETIRKDDPTFWPLRLLQYLAAYPRRSSSWLSWGFTFPNGDLACPLAPDSELNAILLLSPVLTSENFQEMDLVDKKVHFWSVIPVYQEELDYNIQYGTEKLLRKFETLPVTELLDLKRQNVCNPLRPVTGLFDL